MEQPQVRNKEIKCRFREKHLERDSERKTWRIIRRPRRE